MYDKITIFDKILQNYSVRNNFCDFCEIPIQKQNFLTYFVKICQNSERKQYYKISQTKGCSFCNILPANQLFIQIQQSCGKELIFASFLNPIQLNLVSKPNCNAYLAKIMEETVSQNSFQNYFPSYFVKFCHLTKFSFIFCKIL